MKTLIVGLGNPNLGDGGVGWKVVEQVQAQLTQNPTPKGSVDFAFLSVGGMALVEHLMGYDRVMLVDSFVAEDAPGSILVLKLSDMPHYSAFHTAHPQDRSLQDALAWGRAIGAPLPEDLEVVGIVTRHIVNFSPELTPQIAEIVPFAARVVMDLLHQVIKHAEEYQFQE